METISQTAAAAFTTGGRYVKLHKRHLKVSCLIGLIGDKFKAKVRVSRVQHMCCVVVECTLYELCTFP
ncbi:hypothetical protein J6590_046234 [Homalodisca vitripennis]|nr:hypothetical protein J6590_046234 [Homalodisca vitripennis]